MSLNTAIGIGQAIDGKEAALEASRQALDRLEKAAPVLALVFSACEYPRQDIMDGVTPLLGNTPVFEISTILPLAGNAYLPRAVVVTLIGGSDLKAQSRWFPGYAANPQLFANRLLPEFLDGAPSTPGLARPDLMQTRKLTGSLYSERANPDRSAKLLFLGVDGLDGNTEQVCAAVSGKKMAVAGYTSGGKQCPAPGYSLAGNQAGEGVLSAALLNGSFQVGSGASHGWQPVGPSYTVTSTEGNRVLELDGNPAALVYSQILGHPIHDWVTSPLNELIRLYPLGIERADTPEWVVRSPLKVDVDGSLLMNAPVRQGSAAHLLVGSVQSCLKAAQAAAQQAMTALSPSRPALALVFADAAWQMLMEPEGNPEIQAIRSVIGEEVPLVGGYSFGQFARSDTAQPLVFLNQHIEIVLLGRQSQ